MYRVKGNIRQSYLLLQLQRANSHTKLHKHPKLSLVNW